MSSALAFMASLKILVMIMVSLRVFAVRSGGRCAVAVVGSRRRSLAAADQCVEQRRERGSNSESEAGGDHTGGEAREQPSAQDEADTSDHRERLVRLLFQPFAQACIRSRHGPIWFIVRASVFVHGSASVRPSAATTHVQADSR